MFQHPRYSLSSFPSRMIALLSRRAACAAVACLALFASGGCTDLPTGADSFQLQADGQLWTAVVPPRDLPTAATWLEFAAPGSLESRAAATAVALLEAEAARARIDGNIELAGALLEAAAERAVQGMTRDPGSGPFLSGIASLDAWGRTVRSRVDLTRAPELAAAAEAVAHERDAVEAAMLQGDARQAALHLTRASNRVRAWAPQEVALRVLERAMGALDRSTMSDTEGDRVDHLVRSAREELVNGEPLRAVQRALYALQLAQGHGIPEAPLKEHARCGEFTC